MEVGTIRPVLEITVATITILGAGKSWYNGTIRQIIKNAREIPSLKKNQQKIMRSQEDMKDAIIGLSVSHQREDVDTNPEAIANELGATRGVRRFFETTDGSTGMTDLEPAGDDD